MSLRLPSLLQSIVSDVAFALAVAFAFAVPKTVLVICKEVKVNCNANADDAITQPKSPLKSQNDTRCVHQPTSAT